MDSNFFIADKVFHRTCLVPEGKEPDANEFVRIAYIDAHPTSLSLKTDSAPVILLIHGFPQTSYQYRKVIPFFTEAGYRVIVPDYRGAGGSSKPITMTGYKKTSMAADLNYMIKNDLQINCPINVVGHDIGGMVAHAYAAQYPEDVSSICWGECPLPGSTNLKEQKRSVQQWHFVFHCVTDLPEVLIAGKERAYLTHFYDKLSYNRAGITPADVDFYVQTFSTPGAIRAGLNLYRMFDEDSKENVAMREKDGKLKIRCLALNGDKSLHASTGRQMTEEFYDNVEVATISNSSHYIAEENPSDFASKVMEFVGKVATGQLSRPVRRSALNPFASTRGYLSTQIREDYIHIDSCTDEPHILLKFQVVVLNTSTTRTHIQSCQDFVIVVAVTDRTKPNCVKCQQLRQD